MSYWRLNDDHSVRMDRICFELLSDALSKSLDSPLPTVVAPIATADTQDEPKYQEDDSNYFFLARYRSKRKTTSNFITGTTLTFNESKIDAFFSNPVQLSAALGRTDVTTSLACVIFINLAIRMINWLGDFHFHVVLWMISPSIQYSPVVAEGLINHVKYIDLTFFAWRFSHASEISTTLENLRATLFSICLSSSDRQWNIKILT